MRLPTIVSREIDPSNFCVITVGSIKAGDVYNVIPDSAQLLVSMRTIDVKTKEKAKTAIKRAIKAECKASGSPKHPEFLEVEGYPATCNDEKVFALVKEPFREHFGDDFNPYTLRANGSEDLSNLGPSQQKPCFFWFYEGTDQKQWDEAKDNGNFGNSYTGQPLSALYAAHSAHHAGRM